MDNSQGLKKSHRVTISEENNVYHSYDGNIEDLCNIGPEPQALLNLEAQSDKKLNDVISQQSREQEATKQYEKIIEEIIKHNGSARHEIDLSNKYRDGIIKTIQTMQASYTTMGEDFQQIQDTLSICERQQNIIHNEEEVNKTSLDTISSKLQQKNQDKMNYLAKIREEICTIEKKYSQLEKECADKILNLEQEYDNLKEKLQNCIKTISELEQENNNLQEKINELNTLECTLNDDLKKTYEEESKINEEVILFQQNFENEKQALHEQMEALLSRKKNKESEINSLNVKLEDLHKENVHLQKEKKELIESNSKLNLAIKELEQVEVNRLQEINAYSEKISADTSAKSTRLNEANTSLKNYQETEMNIQQVLNNIMVSKEEIEMEFANIEHEIDSKTKSKNEYEENIKSCEIEINGLKEEIQQVEEEISKEEDLRNKLPTKADLELERNKMIKELEECEQHYKHVIETLNSEFQCLKQQQEEELNSINKFYTDEAESLLKINSEKQALIEQSKIDIKNIEADISSVNLECDVMTRKINSRQSVIQMEKKNITFAKHSLSPPVKQPKMSMDARSDTDASTDGETVADILKKRFDKRKKLAAVDKKQRFTQ